MLHTSKNTKEKFAELVVTPVHLTCFTILILLLSLLNVIMYYSPRKTIIVEAKDTTPLVQIYYLKNLLSEHPTYREGWVALAKLEYEFGNMKETREAIAKVKELDPNYSELPSLELLVAR